MSTSNHRRLVLLRLRALVALLGIGSWLLAACGAPGSNDKESREARPDSQITLEFWHYFTDRASLLQQLADQYRQQTGVVIKMQLIPGDTLGQKFQAAAQAKRLPDIAAAWTGVGEGIAPYAKQGTILNLNSHMSDGWADRFYPTHLQAASFQPGNTYGVTPGAYLVPLDANNMQLLYNKKLFDKAGISAAPKTFDEFIEMGDKLAAAGIVPFTSGFGSWPLDSFAQMYQFNVVGPDNMAATFTGKARYTEPSWIKFLQLFERLRNSNVLAEGIIADDMPAAESLFVNGKAAMIFDGSWAIGVFKEKNPTFSDYDVALPPAVTDGSAPLAIPGGVGAQLLVVGTSPHKDEAVKFVRWLTDPEQQIRYATESANLPANKDVAGKLETTPLLKAFSSQMDRVFPTLSTAMPPAVQKTLHAGLQNILAGKSDARVVAEAMQLAQETGQVK